MTSHRNAQCHLLQCPHAGISSKHLLLTTHIQQALTCPILYLELDVWAQLDCQGLCLQLESELSDHDNTLNKGQPTLYWAKAYPVAKALIRNSYPLADVFGQLYRHSLLAVSSWSLPISQVLTASNYLELPRILVAWIIYDTWIHACLGVSH